MNRKNYPLPFELRLNIVGKVMNIIKYSLQFKKVKYSNNLRYHIKYDICVLLKVYNHIT